MHYENSSPFAQASEVVREVEVSHWGSVYFEEEYTVVSWQAQSREDRESACLPSWVCWCPVSRAVLL